MNTLRNHITLLIIGSLVATFGFGLMAYKAQKKYSEFVRQVELSYEVVDYTEARLTSAFSQTTFNNLQKYRASLNENSRQKALSDFISAYSSHNRGRMRKHWQFLLKNEKNYRKYVAPQLPYLRKSFIFYALLAVSTVFISLVVLLIYLRRSVLNPIKDLTHKMLDFLNHKYTYQFTLPKNNEIGQLQGTFNSLAQQVLSNMEELKALDQAKSEFLSIASHELRTPLTSIKGSLSLLNQGVAGNFSDSAKNLIHIAEEETDRLIRLINDILDLAKIEARKFPLALEWQPVTETLSKTFEGLKGLSASAQVSLVHTNSENLEIYVDCDRIQQVLTNLLSNAIKYSPKGGKVTVSCDTGSQDHLIIAVKDEGRGIAPEDQELIFQQFRQATSPQNPLVKGTGLGLAIAKALVEEHGGEIGVHSVPNQGSSFYFSLPKWRLAQASGKTTSPIPEAA